MKITIETIEHCEQRYPTVGDWTYDAKGDLTIRVSKLSDWRREMLVAAHELIEVLLCRHSGVGQGEVDRFDIQYEKDRLDGDFSEPGDDPAAPYHVQHCIATGVERVLAAFLGVSWKDYEQELDNLP